MEDPFIKIRGARANNLKGIDIDIPRDKLIVITGVSGSGKSSLAFDTLFAEGQRRFAESISSFARQFIGRISKPAVENISGIPPAIAVEQKVNTHNPRSTVGSITEIFDYLRVLYAKIGKTYSPISGEEVRCDSTDSVTNYLLSCNEGSTIYILSAIDWVKEGQTEKLLELKQNGFSRLYSIQSNKIDKIETILQDSSALRLEEDFLLIDRLSLDGDEETTSRITDSVRTAFNEGHGSIQCIVQCREEQFSKSFSNLFEADGITFEKGEEWLFNYNNPLGACHQCGGYGKILGIDETLVIPDPSLSIYEGAVACWRGNIMKYFNEEIISNVNKIDLPIHTPYKELTESQKETLWNGNQHITGINGFFDELEKKKYKIQNRYMISRYSGKTTCPSCKGTRFTKEALYVKIGDKNIAQLMDMPIHELITFFKEIRLTPHDREIAHKALKEIEERLSYIDNVGLGYLTLSRHSNTLSGGESQRINLVTTLGNTLTGSMYILDEPSIGLHQKDTQRLISILKKLRDTGNTVIVVEHDEEIIRAADYLIDIGPGAGINGGEIVYQGVPPDGHSLIQSGKSLTLQYLNGEKSIPMPPYKRVSKNYIQITGAAQNNLKNIDVKFRLKAMTAVVGVSGSGKSSLVGEILYPALCRHLNKYTQKPGLYKELKGDLKNITSVEYIDQNPIGKNSRSNPATYIKAYDEIRKLFSEQPYAKSNGYGHSHFSFNIDGGRCPECQGEGKVKIPMQFMADITIPCETCGGKRFIPDILEVRYKEKNINDVLEMSVDQAISFFSSQEESQAQKIAEKLKPLQAVGLNYIKLGQSSSTLSGGESQRVKLASFLSKDTQNTNSDSILFIFDEPTTGLHFDDVKKLLTSFNALLDRGNTIIVVEHNPFIIQAADYIIELDNGYCIKST